MSPSDESDCTTLDMITVIQNLPASPAAESAWEGLLHEVLKRSKAHARRYFGHGRDGDEIAADIAQEVGVVVLQKLPTLRITTEARWWAWMYRVCDNLCIDEKRKDRRNPKAATDRIPDPRQVERWVLRLIGRHELKMELNSALNRLPERSKCVIALRFIEELEVAETAERLGLTAKQVSQAQWNGLQKLKDDRQLIRATSH